MGSERDGGGSNPDDETVVASDAGWLGASGGLRVALGSGTA